MAKVADRLTDEYGALISASPFFALASAGPEGLDCSPRVKGAGLWNPAKHVEADQIPTPGDVLRARTGGDIDSRAYDEQRLERANATMW